MLRKEKECVEVKEQSREEMLREEGQRESSCTTATERSIPVFHCET